MAVRVESWWSRVATGALLVYLGALWLPFVVLCAWAYPAVDDFVESVWSDFFANQRTRYLGFTGRFVGSALQAVNPWHWNALGIYRATAVLRIVLFLVAAWTLVRVLERRWLQASSLEAAYLAALVCTSWLAVLPAPAELFYWYSASVVYFLPLSVLLLALAANLARPARVEDGHPLVLASYVGFLLIAGAVEMLPLLVLAASVPLALQVRRQGRLWTRRMAVIAAVTTVGLAVNLASPGNRVRLEHMAATRDAVPAHFAWMLAATTLDAFPRWLPSPWLWVPALLAAPVFLRRARAGLRLPHPAAVLALWALALAVVYATPLWGLGFLVGRVENLALLVFVLGLYAWVAASAAWLARGVGRAAPADRVLAVAAAVVLVATTILGRGRPSDRSTVGRAYKELRIGRAAAYAQAEAERAAWMRRTRCTHVVVPPLGVLSKVLAPVVIETPYGLDVLASEPSTWWGNYAYALYYRKDSVRVAPTADADACARP